MSIDRVLVVGAGGALGQEIVRTLCAKGVAVQATYRTRREDVEKRLAAIGAEPVMLDLSDSERLERLLADRDGAIFTPILTISKAAASALGEGRRAVFFSSNNVAVDPQADIYARLSQAEEEVLQAAPAATILRPTMIYGHPEDGNLSRLMTAMRRLPVVPLAGARAPQQPVYYRDLAAIAVERLLAPKDEDRLFAVAGPAPVSQRDLYRTAARAAGARPAIVPIPAERLAPVFRLIEKTGLKPPLTAAQLARAGRDKTASGAPVILGTTTLEAGLGALAAALDARRSGA